MQDYTKPALTIEEQIRLLKSRGLLFYNEDNARKAVKQINYYRLSAYCIPFETRRHQFEKDVSFEDVLGLYEFDRCLRFLIDEALEVIEISLRAQISYYLARKYGAFSHEEQKNFFISRKFNYSEWLNKVHEEIRRSNEIFIKHYKNKYNDFPVIPIWMAVEVMSFGSLSVIYHNLKRPDQKAVAAEYCLHYRVLASWLHTFTYIRNICAHHSRLWNKELSIAMEVPKKEEWKQVKAKRIASVLYAIIYMLKKVIYD
ncbi:MAG: Abi family protein [Candidatus Goldiibacteriota bacterium]